jgi:predicted HicB family RNase H-like nuclease
MSTKKHDKSKKMGRPSKGLTGQLHVRVSPAEAKMLQAEAKKHGITISGLLMRPWRTGQKER